ncbi:sel1 repeat family protein [bacterium]|nr:sel1 repeat family protein [bacterium]
MNINKLCRHFIFSALFIAALAAPGSAEPTVSSHKVRTPSKYQMTELSELRSLAGKGDPEAQYQLGERYFEGIGVDKDLKQAFLCFGKAAQQGHAEAQFMLGRCYHMGWGCGKDPLTANHWYFQAAEQGVSQAQFYLNSLKAEEGDVIAQCNLADSYYDGNGTEKDFAKAAYWYKQAAEQGEAYAQFMTGLCYFRGEGFSQSYDEAIKWYRLAAEQGDANAQYNLAVCYICDNNENNNAEALDLLNKAQQAKRVQETQALIGFLYLTGWNNIVKRDVSLAEAALNDASQNGSWTGNLFNSVSLCSHYGEESRDKCMAQLRTAYSIATYEKRKFQNADELKSSSKVIDKLILAMLYANGAGAAKDEAKAWQLLREVSERIGKGELTEEDFVSLADLFQFHPAV